MTLAELNGFFVADMVYCRWNSPNDDRGNCLIKKLKIKMERKKGFEPSTPTLARLCSTPELLPRKSDGIISQENLKSPVEYLVFFSGTAGRTRTGTLSLESDFESDVSTIPPPRHLLGVKA